MKQPRPKAAWMYYTWWTRMRRPDVRIDGYSVGCSVLKSGVYASRTPKFTPDHPCSLFPRSCRAKISLLDIRMMTPQLDFTKLQEDDQGGIDPSWAPVNFGSRGSDARHEQQQQHDARSFGIGAQGRAIPIRSRLANGGAGDGWRLTGARNFGEGSSGGGGDNNADHGVYTTPLARQMPLVNEAGQPGNYRQQFEYRGHRDRSDEYSRKQGRSNQQDHMLLGGHQRQDEQLLKAIAMSEIALPPPASRDRSNALRNVTPETGPAAVVDTGTSAVNGGAWAPSTGTARHHHARAASTSASISTAGSPQGSGASDRIGPENKRQVHRYAKRARKPRAPYRCRSSLV